MVGRGFLVALLPCSPHHLVGSLHVVGARLCLLLDDLQKGGASRVSMLVRRAARLIDAPHVCIVLPKL